MSIQTSDALYRRHEREWAAFRDAVEHNESNQKRNDPASEEPVYGNKPSDHE